MTHNINKKISAEQGESSLQGASMDKPTARKKTIYKPVARLNKRWGTVKKLLDTYIKTNKKSS